MENDSNDKELIEDLFMSSDFKKLDAILAKKGPNIFRILGWGSDEVRFSKFLAWLMNPNGSHRLDDKFLKAFLEQALKDISDEKKEGVPAAIDIHTMRLDDAEIRTEEQMEGDKRADITIRDYTDGFFCLIENKVWSGEQIYADDSGKTIYQTQDYAKKAKELAGKIRENSNPLLIFLTPYGYSAESEKFIPVSFHTLIETLDQLLEAEAINDVTTTLIKQFRDNLKEVIGMADGTRSYEVRAEVNRLMRELILGVLIDGGKTISFEGGIGIHDVGFGTRTQDLDFYAAAVARAFRLPNTYSSESDMHHMWDVLMKTVNDVRPLFASDLPVGDRQRRDAGYPAK